MKCTNYIATETYGYKGKTRIVACRPEHVDIVYSAGYPDHRKLQTDPATDKIWNPCTGTLKVDIQAVDEPDFHSDHYAELRVKFICSVCGEILFTPKNMGDKYNISDFVNALMDRVDELPFLDSSTIEWEKRDVMNALTQKFTEEGQKDPRREAMRVFTAYITKNPGHFNVEIARKANLL